MVSSSINVSVLVVQHGQTDLTWRAVQAVRRTHYAGKVEVLVYDNASSDGPGPVAECCEARVIRGESNLGFGPANNLLAQEASGDLLLFLNNDTCLAPSALGLLVEQMSSAPGVIAVTPQQRSFDGRVLELGVFLDAGGRGLQLFRALRAPRSLAQRTLRCHYGSAACLLVRRADFLRVGGFDPCYAPAYYEDADLCLKLRAGGGEVLVEPRAVAYHLEGATSNSLGDGFGRWQELANRSRFLSRWARDLSPLPPRNLGSGLLQALGSGDRPAVLWVLPELLKPDQAGGDARVWREVLSLRAAGFVVAIWSEHLGDAETYLELFDRHGVVCLGYRDAARWPLDDHSDSCLSLLQDVLRLGIWDAVVTWCIGTTERFGPLIREHAPGACHVVDSTVLLHRQFERGVEVSANVPGSLEVSREREIAAYATGDAVIASSSADAEFLRQALPNGTGVFSFDVGAYPPVQPNGAPCAGSKGGTSDGQEHDYDDGHYDGQANGRVVFLGNFLHPPNIDAVEWWMEEVVPELERISGRAPCLRVVGAFADSILRGRSRPGALELVGWVPELSTEFSRARVFVAPLRYGAGTKDKISMAMRFGVPTVTTSIGAESMPEDLLSALHVHDDASGFAGAVAQLVTNRSGWRRAAYRTRKAALTAWQQQQRSAHRFPAWMQGIIQSQQGR